MADPPLVFLVAGEPSGDAIGARLMTALRARTGDHVRFAGIGGDRMTATGLESLFPQSDLTVMGIAEVIPRIPRLLRRLRETVAAIRDCAPDVVVTIDAPGFSYRIARRLARRPFPLIHYVAPTVWAWRPGRAAKLARLVDHLLAILPFEPPWFERVGLACTFVGHPVVEEQDGTGDGPGFRERHGIGPEAMLLCVLPGSRSSEVRRLLPPFGTVVAELAGRHPDLQVVIPTVSGVAEAVRAAAATWPASPIVVGQADKGDAFAASSAALAASGTVSLELALAAVPHVIAYRVNPLSAAIARRLIKVRYASLVNLLADAPIVPEYLQGNCTVDRLVPAVERLLTDPEAAATQRRDAGRSVAELGFDGSPPSHRAADAVLAIMRGSGQAAG